MSDANGALIQSVRNGDSGYDPVIEADQLEKILGLSRHDSEGRDREARRGVVRDLVVTGMGEGEIMPVESIATPGNGNLKLTESLDDVCFSTPVFRRRFEVLTWVCLSRFSRRARARAQSGQDAHVRPWNH